MTKPTDARPRNHAFLSAVAALAIAMAILASEGGLLRPLPAEAEGFLVTTAGDAGDGTCDETCTLRDAVDDANQATTDDVITFAPGITDIVLESGPLRLRGTLTIDGGAGVTVRRNPMAAEFNIIWVESAAVVDLTGLTVSGGRAERGGGIYVGMGEDTKLTLTDSTVSGNSASFQGGGIMIDGGRVFVIRSTISNNESSNLGGGIYKFLGFTEISNSTISGNSAAEGGGLSNQGDQMWVSNSTITENRGSSGGGLVHSGQGLVLVMNTIIASQAAGTDCRGDSSGLVPNGNNIDSDGTCFGNRPGGFTGNADLLPLADNGGPTQTHALGPDSDALDAGRPDVCLVPEFPTVGNIDQRGVPRFQEGDGVPPADCDIGAYEAVMDAGLAVDMTCAPQEAAPGDQVICEVTVTNQATVLGATLSLDTPPGTSFLSLVAPDGWQCDTPDPGGAGSVFCDPDLEPGSTSVFRLTLQIDPGAPPGTEFTIEVIVDSVDPNVSAVVASVTVAVPLAGLSVTKVCVGDGFEASFALVVDGGVALPVACGTSVSFPDLAPGPHTLTETITGPDAEGFATAIACEGAAPAGGRSATVQDDVACVVVNVFSAGVDGDEDLLPLLAFLPLGVEIDNANTNVIAIDNTNDNTNQNGNANANDNANENVNENDNLNTNTQDQGNDQAQDNANEQSNNIDASPEVNIE